MKRPIPFQIINFIPFSQHILTRLWASWALDCELALSSRTNIIISMPAASAFSPNDLVPMTVESWSVYKSIVGAKFRFIPIAASSRAM